MRIDSLLRENVSVGDRLAIVGSYLLNIITFLLLHKAIFKQN